jgi:deoxyribonuclease (pyrimidine dimer)
MTRISIVDPIYLADQHVFADIREGNRLGNLYDSYINRIRKGIKEEPLPEKFTLGKGHVRFFYNKGLFLEKRFNSLLEEYNKRGRGKPYSFPFRNTWNENSKDYSDWKPNDADLKLIKSRLRERIMAKQNFYTYYGKPLDEKFLSYYI